MSKFCLAPCRDSLKAAIIFTMVMGILHGLSGLKADAKTHVEDVPTQVAHPELEPHAPVKNQDGRLSLQGTVQKNQELDLLNAKLGIASRPEGKGQFPAVVTKVTPGSPFAKRGVTTDDILLGEVKDFDGSLQLIMEHAGQGMRFNIKATELKAALAVASPAVSVPRTGLIAGLVDTKKKQYNSLVDVLWNHDLGLIIDESGSMTTPDCPGGLTRWEWCCQQSQALAEAAAQASSSIDASVFNENYQTYRHIKPLQIPKIFSDNSPGGGTEPAYALKEQLENYFNSARTKPLTIVIVTDGLPNEPMNIAQVLKEESEKIRYQGEVTITIMVVGEPIDDAHMRRVLGLTPGSSVRNGGLVDIIPFQTTVGYGVKNALFADLKDVRQCTDPRRPSRASSTVTGVGTDPMRDSNFLRYHPGEYGHGP